MRLTAEQAQVIRQIVEATLGDGARVYLFGSRTDDNRRGGDIDLLVEPATAMTADDRLEAKLTMLAALHRRLGERRIDLIFHRPDRPETVFQRLARRQGIRL